MMDVVYIYKSNGSEELRYSLRSLQNIPHRNVYVSGDFEPWFSDKIIHLPRRRYKLIPGHPKYYDAEQNMLHALEQVDLSDDFIMMNDDFFIMKPVNNIPNYHLGSLQKTHQERIARHGRSEYTDAIDFTKTYLESMGIDNPLNYSIHLPVVMNKSYRSIVSKLLAAIPRDKIPLTRSIYGNLFLQPAEEIEDVKVYDNETILDTDFISTDENRSFKSGRIGDLIRDRFPDKSIYERD